MVERAQLSPAPAGVLDALLESYNRGAPDDAAGLYAADGTHEDVAQQRRVSGVEAIARGLASFLRSFPDATWTVVHRLGDDDSAAAAYRLTGQPLDLQGLMLIRVADGQITSSRDFWDAGTLGRQLGGPR
jgi:ketosteroid isomerase-like protein